MGGVLAAALLFYAGWRIGVSSNKPVATGKTSQASTAAGPLNHKSLITDENFHILQGMAYADAGMLNQAIFEEQEALRINPRNVPALNNLGYFSFQKGLYAESAGALERAIRLEPNSSLVKNNLRNTYTKGLASAATEAARQSFRKRKEKLESADLADYFKQLDAEPSISKP